MIEIIKVALILLGFYIQECIHSLKTLLTRISFFILDSLIEAQAQTCSLSGTGNNFIELNPCAPSQVQWKIIYTGLNAGNTNEVIIDWGDGMKRPIDIEILPDPVASFTVNPSSAQCEGTDGTLKNTSINVPASGTSWKWEIRKNNSSGQLVNLIASGSAATTKDIISIPHCLILVLPPRQIMW